MTIEKTIEKLAIYLKTGTLPEPGHKFIWSVKELAEKTRTSSLMVGKIRKHYTRALAQAITPGVDPIFFIEPSKLFGINAIILGNSTNVLGCVGSGFCLAGLLY